MSTKNFVTNPLIFMNEADALNYIDSSQVSTGKTSGNQWILCLAGGILIIGVLIYASYLSKRTAIPLHRQKSTE